MAKRRNCSEQAYEEQVSRVSRIITKVTSMPKFKADKLARKAIVR